MQSIDIQEAIPLLRHFLTMAHRQAIVNDHVPVNYYVREDWLAHLSTQVFAEHTQLMQWTNGYSCPSAPETLFDEGRVLVWANTTVYPIDVDSHQIAIVGEVYGLWKIVLNDRFKVVVHHG